MNLINFLYSGSKGSRKCSKVLHYPKEKWVIIGIFYFPIGCMHLTMNRNIPIMPISLFWNNAKFAKLYTNFATLQQWFRINFLSDLNQELSKLFKTVRNLKIGHTLASHVIQKRTLTIMIILFWIWSYKIKSEQPY